VLGRLALTRKDVNAAKGHLLASARLPAGAGPFEPNMTLAQDLLESGERAVVLEYLEMCRSFWTFDQGQIDRKIKLLKAPGTPDLTQRRFSQGFTLMGRPAPPFKLKDLSGKEWSPDQIKDKAIAIEFFTANCKLCREELALLNQFAAGRTDMVAFAVAVGENEKAARDFVEANHLTMPVLLDPTSVAATRYEADAYPTLAVIDRKGSVSLHLIGRDMARDIERAIAGPPPRITLPAPIPIAAAPGKIAWEPVDGAESYVVEWDRKETEGWLRVIPTRDTAVSLEASGALRWRVYAVSFREGRGTPSAWKDLHP
jgi:peroxiredoxin